MDNLISISNINDFIFCPVSIYFHNIDEDTQLLNQTENQLSGSFLHQKVDDSSYSTKKSILQGVSIYCNKYRLIGKIDTFDIDKGLLTEKKRKIKTIYDGYIFQLYAQYFCLEEMGYTIKKMQLYSIQDNKKYNIPLPCEDTTMYDKFLITLKKIDTFEFDNFIQTNVLKCKYCIYEELCLYSGLK